MFAIKVSLSQLYTVLLHHIWSQAYDASYATTVALKLTVYCYIANMQTVTMLLLEYRKILLIADVANIYLWINYPTLSHF